MSAGATVTFDTKGIEKTIKVLNKMGKSPQKAVNKAAGKAGTVLKKAVKSNLPKDRSGNLKKSIIRVGERVRKRGKKAYQVTFDRKMNEVLQKPIQRPGLLGGRYPKGYYPSSMNFGYLKRLPGEGYYYEREVLGSNQYVKKTEMAYKLPSEHVDGFHFLEKGVQDSDPTVREIMVDKTMEELIKIWQSNK